MQIKSMITAGLILLLGCQNPSKQQQQTSNPENPQQDSFISFVTKNCESYDKLTNEIQQKDYFHQFENNFSQLCDTLGVFDNWKGTITEIKPFEWTSENLTELKVDIQIKLTEYRNITFRSDRFFSTKDLDSSLVYRQLKNLNTGSTVYFNGFVARDKNNKIGYDDMLTTQDFEKICNPNIKFYIISIGRDVLHFTSTEKFKQVNALQKSIWQTMEDRVSEKLTEKQFKSKLNDYKKQLEPLGASFTPEEKAYVQSYTECLAAQYNAK